MRNAINHSNVWLNIEFKFSFHFSIPDTIQQFPEDIRPYTPITFDDVIPISAKTCPEDVYNLKGTLRKFLDLYIDEGLKKKEEDFVKDLQMKMREHGPRLA